MKQHNSKPWYARLGVGLVGLGFLSVGVSPLLKGDLLHQKNWGAVVFTPSGILVGALVLYMATFGWRRLESRDEDKNYKTRGIADNSPGINWNVMRSANIT